MKNMMLTGFSSPLDLKWRKPMRTKILILSLLLAGCITLLIAAESKAVPMPWDEEVPDPNNPGRTIRRVIPGTATWANGTTINVFVNNDPQQGGIRHERIREGIQRWANEAQNRGITINVQTGTPPQGTQNVVEVRWVAPNSLPRDAQGNRQDAVADTDADVVTNGNGNQRMDGITGGRILIESDTTGDDFLRNLGMHEFGHSLGLADEPTQAGQPHNAMDHQVNGTGVQGFTARDIAEINTVYGNPQGQQPQANVQGALRQQGGGYRYKYLVSWLNGPEIPFFQVDPAGIFDISMPSGWRLFDPETSVGRDEYMEDAFTNLSGVLYSEQTALTFFTFTNPLSTNNPYGLFSFSSFSPPTDVLAYAMGENYFLVPGPTSKIVPEPSTWLLLSSGLTGLIGLTRRSSRRHRARG
jgi:hypothetical protein